jgi:hypothetical protein
MLSLQYSNKKRTLASLGSNWVEATLPEIVHNIVVFSLSSLVDPCPRTRRGAPFKKKGICPIYIYTNDNRGIIRAN